MKPQAFRLTSTVLLAGLIIGTIGVLATVSLELVTQQQERTQKLVQQVRSDLADALVARAHADRIARRTLGLEAHRLRLSILVDTCTVARLEHQHAPRCDGVKQRAKHLAKIVRAFREQLQDASSPATPPGGTTTVTKTKTASPPPHVGNSGNCPPSNPHCEEGDS